MLLIPSNMVFSKVQSWNDVNECERNNNNNNDSVKSDILRTPPRCTFTLLFFTFKKFLVSPLGICCCRQFGVSNLQNMHSTSDFHEIYLPHTHTFYLSASLSLSRTNGSYKKYHFIPYFTHKKNRISYLCY